MTTASGIVLGLVLPLAMFTANRSAAMMLAIAALLGLAGVWQAGRIGEIGALLRRRWPWAALLAAGFVALSSLSPLWAHSPRGSITSLGEFYAAALAALLLGLAYAAKMPARLGLTLAIGITLAALAAIADLKTGMVYRVRMGIRTDLYVLNRSVVCFLLLAWPMALLMTKRWRALAALAAVVLTVAVVMSESGAAKLGLLAGGSAAGLAWRWPRLSLAGVFGGACLAVLIAPWVGSIGAAVLPAKLHTTLAEAHSNDRVAIWQSFGAAVEQRPLLGSGFGASTRMADDPLVQQVAEPLRRMLGAGHPHNSFLQVWVELGAAGAALVLAVLILLWRACVGLPPAVLPWATGLGATVVSIAAVSHGAWQAWWIASVGAAVVLVTVTAGRMRNERI